MAVSAPITAAAMGAGPRPPLVRRSMVIASIWLGGVALSCAVFAYVWRTEEARTRQEFEWRAHSQAQALRDTLLDHDEVIFTMWNLYDSSEEVTADEFRRTAADLRARHPGVHSLQWLPYVRQEQRAEFEARVREGLQKPFFINRQHEPGSPLEPAPVSDGYAPALYTEPIENLRSALGSDFLHGLHRREIELAIDSAKRVATPRVPLYGSENGEPGWLVFMPVYAADSTPPTVEERRAKLLGVLLGEFRFSALMDSDLLGLPDRSLDLLLADRTPSEPEQILVVSVANGANPEMPRTIASFESGMHRVFPLRENGREWTLLCRPAAEWIAAQRCFYPYEFFAIGLLLTALGTGSVRGAQKRTAAIEQLVSERTAALHATQLALEEDLVERQRMIEEGIDQGARLRLALSAAELGTWEWDRESNRVTWSPETERIFGIAPGAFDGTYEMYHRCLHPDEHERIDSVNRGAWDRGDEIFHEHRIVWPDGTVRWLTSRGDVLRDSSGKVTRMIGAVMDVTAQRAAVEERAEFDRRLQETQKLESLGVLAGGIAHDFNNLLTGILGNASLARMDLEPASPIQTYLDQIERVSQRAAELCKQMLAYSGKARFVIQQLDLSQLIAEMAPLLRVSISKNATLECHNECSLPAISADPTQLRQIIMNLVINASDAMGENSGVIGIRTGLRNADRATFSGAHLGSDLAPGSYVFLEVRDTGCGMSADIRAKIFDPFFTTKFTGRGLGLAAVLGIVRGHHAALRVDSEPGRGTTFTLLLPCAEGVAEDIAPSEPDEETWRGSGCVLVVDDEETVRRIAGRMLESIGFSVVMAENGREAVEKFRAAPSRFTAVLLDLTMPEMDGTEAFVELRRIDPHMCVLLMSGFNEQEAIANFAGRGLAGFMQKPFKPGTLRAKMRAILEKD